MARYRIFTLTESQKEELTTLRNQTKAEYVRERCAALLKIAGGETPHRVARQGLLRPRDPDTVYAWLNIYEAEGISGLAGHRQGGPHRGCL